MPEKSVPVSFPSEKPKDELFALIKSLNQSEKRYIKLYSSHGTGEKKYLLLFDAMDAEARYDEKAFTEKHSESSFVKYLAATKRFLKLFILRAMRAYHEERTREDEINAYLRNYRFLCEKGLYALAYKQLIRAKSMAEDRQLDLRLLEINEITSKHHIEHAEKMGNLRETISGLQKEQKSILERLQVEYLFTNTYHQVLIEYREGSRKELTEMIERRLNPLNLESVLEGDSKYSFNSKLYFLYLHVLLAEQQNQLDKSRLIYTQILHLFRSENRTSDEDIKRYAKAIANYLNACHHPRYYQDFEEKLQLLRKMQQQAGSSDLKGEIMQNLLLMEMLFYMNTDQWERARSIPAQVRDLYLQHAPKVNKSRELSLSFNCLLIWFFNEEWNKMRPWLEHILSRKRSGFRQGVLEASRILKVIYHFEKKDYELVTYLKRAATRRVNSKMNKKLLSHVEKINDAPIFDQKAKFASLTVFLLEHLSDPQSVNTAGFTEMYYWAKSRAEGISIIEAVKHYLLP